MTTNMPPDEESTDTEYINTDVAHVRVSGPADKSREIPVPGNAPLETVEERAFLVALYVLDYDCAGIATVNGRSKHFDGTLDDEPYPGYDGKHEASA